MPDKYDLSGRRIAFLVANEGVEQVELTTPWQAVIDQGGAPELVAPHSGEVQAMNHLDRGDTFIADRTVGDVRANDYEGIVLPGGVANPDQLRTNADAVEFVRQIFASGKPAAVICHGPWTLVEAGVVAGRTLTSWPSLQTDIRNAGGTSGRRRSPGLRRRSERAGYAASPTTSRLLPSVLESGAARKRAPTISPRHEPTGYTRLGASAAQLRMMPAPTATRSPTRTRSEYPSRVGRCTRVLRGSFAPCPRFSASLSPSASESLGWRRRSRHHFHAINATTTGATTRRMRNVRRPSGSTRSGVERRCPANLHRTTRRKRSRPRIRMQCGSVG